MPITVMLSAQRFHIGEEDFEETVQGLTSINPDQIMERGLLGKNYHTIRDDVLFCVEDDNEKLRPFCKVVIIEADIIILNQGIQVAFVHA